MLGSIVILPLIVEEHALGIVPKCRKRNLVAIGKLEFLCVFYDN